MASSTSTTTTQPPVSKTWPYLCGALSFAAGAFAFYQTQKVTKEMFDPIVAACTSKEYTTSMKDFVAQTGYHAYDTNVGLHLLDPFVCIITQFLHDLADEANQPQGKMMWYATIVTAFPLTVLTTIEAGRQYHRGPILYPTLMGLLYQALGVSVVFPLVWVPAYCIWGNDPNGRQGFVSLTRARAALFMALPATIVSVMVFEMDTTTDLWTLCAGVLGGPLIALVPLLLWGAGPPLALTKEEKVLSTETCAFAYGISGMISLIGWFYLAFMYARTYGLDVKQFWGDVWAGHYDEEQENAYVKANPSVQFMAIDAFVLWIGMMLHIGSRNFESMFETLLYTPFFGPGAACAMALAAKEMDNAPNLTENEETKKKN